MVFILICLRLAFLKRGVGKWKPSSQKATDKLECVSNN
ncbi:hypothetical protein V6Z12_D11G324700 [Gossypium hirsutum]